MQKVDDDIKFLNEIFLCVHMEHTTFPLQSGLQPYLYLNRDQ
jgi:hypothetical protein